MLDGLKPKWTDLSHAQISGHFTPKLRHKKAKNMCSCNGPSTRHKGQLSNAMNNMVYTMLDGLKPKWIDLSHAQISGHNTKTNAQKGKANMHMPWPIK